ncbi:uncharacterized protein LOC134817019 [Bolinopsis microptera]|uniref:uncharacterized protein LOC134817019 n=1 Tax=Bolinopsis microptera TaxID=2820187 RepID=UPI00307A4B31
MEDDRKSRNFLSRTSKALGFKPRKRKYNPDKFDHISDFEDELDLEIIDVEVEVPRDDKLGDQEEPEPLIIAFEYPEEEMPVWYTSIKALSFGGAAEEPLLLRAAEVQTVEFHDCFDSSRENLVNNEKKPPQNKIEETVSKLVGEHSLPVPTSPTAAGPSKSLSLLRAISRESQELEEVKVRRMSDRVKFLEHQDDRSNGSRDGSRDDHLNEEGQYFSDNQMKVFETIFQRLDINGDGQVSPSELRKALKFMDIRVDKAVCARMVYDFNEDGFLDIDIFMDMVTELFRKGYLDPITYNIELAQDQKKKKVINSADDLLRIFHSFDQDNSGNISKSEIRSIAGDLGLPMSDLEIEKFMERADRNGDGSIDQDEFLEYFGTLLF